MVLLQMLYCTGTYVHNLHNYVGYYIHDFSNPQVCNRTQLGRVIFEEVSNS